MQILHLLMGDFVHIHEEHQVNAENFQETYTNRKMHTCMHLKHLPVDSVVCCEPHHPHGVLNLGSNFSHSPSITSQKCMTHNPSDA